MSKLPIALAAIILAVSPALAGGEPYYMPPQYSEAPPVTVYAAPPPPPFVALGAGIGGLVAGAISLPFAVLGGIFGPPQPANVSCVAPDGSLFPCAAYPPPPPLGYSPGDAEPPYAPDATQVPDWPRRPPSRDD
ncbi:MAG TPA: hypothetical protein VGP28_04325 [Methylocella sp.]|jgi:hypothetical protein|nr:hypothetical protein [Methylocella sp.]